MGLQKIPTVILAICLAACSRQHAPESPPPPKPTVFDPLTRQLDQARAVQSSVDASAEAARRAVDAQERGDSTP